MAQKYQPLAVSRNPARLLAQVLDEEQFAEDPEEEPPCPTPSVH
jgi:hypothetical protein